MVDDTRSTQPGRSRPRGGSPIELLYLTHLGELRATERRVEQALSRLARAAHSERLRSALEESRAHAVEQVRRLDDILDREPAKEPSARREPLETLGLVARLNDPAAFDLALIRVVDRDLCETLKGYAWAHILSERLAGTNGESSLFRRCLVERSDAGLQLLEIAQQILTDASGSA